MKKILTLCLVLASVACFGQTTVGLKGGLNLAKLRLSQGSISVSTDSRTAFCAGMFFRSPMGEKGSFQTEILYSSQGGTGFSTSGSGGELTLDYILLPLMFRYHANETVSLQVGPQLGLLLDASAGGTSVTKDMSSFDFGLNFGVGFEFSGGVDLSFRYCLGLTNTIGNTSSSGGSSSSVSMTNQVMQFALGFKLSKN